MLGDILLCNLFSHPLKVYMLYAISLFLLNYYLIWYNNAFTQ